MSEKPKWTEIEFCTARSVCRDCRLDGRYRDSVRKIFEVPEDFDEKCPYGISFEGPPMPVSRPRTAADGVPEMPPNVRVATCMECSEYDSGTGLCDILLEYVRDFAGRKGAFCPRKRWPE